MQLLKPLALSCVLFPCSAVAQAVHVVKADGTGDFTSIQAAVDAAAPGDHVLVHGGFTANVVLEREITLVAATGATIMKPASGPGASSPALAIRNLPAGEHVRVSGVSVFVGNGGAPSAVEVADCAGSVWLQDMFVDSYGASALDVRACVSVVLVHSALQTNLVPALADGTPQTAAGARVSQGAHLHAWSTEFTGSHGSLQGGGLPVPNGPPDGGAGLHVVDASVSCYGGQIRGGSGNSFWNGSCVSGGDGGDGVLAQDTQEPFDTQVRLVGTSLQPGSGSWAVCGGATMPGLDYDGPVGALQQLPGPGRLFELPGHALAGAPLSLTFSGSPGDFAFLVVSSNAVPGAAIAGLDLHVALPPLLVLGPFALPAGSATIAATAPALPLGLAGVALPMQAVHLDAGFALHASSPRALLVH
jgi:hypothetical protein